VKKTLIFLTLLLSFNQVMAKTRHHLLIPSVFSYIVYDFEHNAILKEKNSTQTHSIASLTKLMTANVFLTHETSPELCTNHLTEEDIDHLKHTHSRLPQNDTFTCDKLLQAMLISSDNMAASALSRLKLIM
jgi:D-alanyl-D-alanine endopeptidase (penicillin-binding protein 7)